MTCNSLEKVTHAFIGSCLDYYNTLSYGLPQSSVSKLQHIQNATARVLMGTKKFDLITPVLKSSHSVPVEKRIDFKVLLLVHRALHDQTLEYIRDTLHERTNV